MKPAHIFSIAIIALYTLIPARLNIDPELPLFQSLPRATYTIKTTLDGRFTHSALIKLPNKEVALITTKTICDLSEVSSAEYILINHEKELFYGTILFKSEQYNLCLIRPNLPDYYKFDALTPSTLKLDAHSEKSFNPKLYYVGTRGAVTTKFINIIRWNARNPNPTSTSDLWQVANYGLLASPANELDEGQPVVDKDLGLIGILAKPLNGEDHTVFVSILDISAFLMEEYLK